MRVLLSWLRELVAIPDDADEVARRLTMSGLEVEKIDHLDHGLEKVVVGEVRERKPIEGTKLSVCQVFDGLQELQIVCGAQNYAAGDHVPVALVGATLPNGTAIGQAKLRGIDSFGMLCSGKELSTDELNWDDGVDGLFILPRDTVPGTSIAKVIGRDDVIFELNVTPNRGDALSHLGVARDLAVLFDTPVKHDVAAPPASGAASATIQIAAPELCSRFCGQVIEGMKIGPSPAWLANRLRAIGQRPINNLVDATNYVMFELGQPMHAYDFDRVAGRKLIARRANAGETLRTLDGQVRALSTDDLVIADIAVPVGLAGVMGGEDSEVKPATTRLLLEAAHFAPSTVRRTKKRYGFTSDASFRFERGVDPEGTLRALQRLTGLILQVAGGNVVGGPIDVTAVPYSAPVVTLKQTQVTALLGAQVPWAESTKILTGLGLQARSFNDEEATFAVPGFRPDISSVPDLIEEIARIRGFEGIPSTVLSGAGTRADEPAWLTAERRLRQALSVAGLDEAVNHAFVPAADLALLRPEVKPIALQNPIRLEQGVMRTTLIAGLLRNVEHNVRFGVPVTRSYEIGRIYLPHAAAPEHAPKSAGYAVAIELRRLALVANGPRPSNWIGGKDSFDFYDLKGAVEQVLDGLALRDAEFRKATVPWLHPVSSAEVLHAGRVLGVLGELHPTVAEAFGVPRGVFVAELDLGALTERAQLVPRFKGLPSFPASLRDLAIVVDERVTAAEVAAEIRRADAQQLIEGVQLFDVYVSEKLGAGKRSLAYSLRYRSSARTLTDDEVNAVHAAIVERLGSVFGAALRGV